MSVDVAFIPNHTKVCSTACFSPHTTMILTKCSLAVSFGIAASHVILAVHPALETSQRLRRSDSTASSAYWSGLTSSGSETSSGFGGASSNSASDASSGSVVDPHWWSPYSEYYGRKIPQIFRRNTIVVSEYREFIKRIEAAKESLK